MHIRVHLRLLVIVLMVLIAAVPAVGQPRSQEDIERRLAEIEELQRELDEREGEVRGGISEADARRDALSRELAELQAVLDEVQGRVRVQASELGQVQAALAAKTEELRRTEERLEARLAQLRARAVDVYKHGPASLLQAVMQIDGLGDLFRRLSYVIRVVEDDNRRVDEIQRIRARIAREREEVERLRDIEAAKLAVVSAERNQAAGVRNTVDGRRQAAEGELRGHYEDLGDIERQREQYERETADLQAESAAIAAFLRAHGDGEAEVSPKGMTWPVNGPVTSGYGWRTHPIFGTQRFHAGIDIGAPSGTPIVAAGSGSVVFVRTQCPPGESCGYGNYMIIDHGGGIATLYAHMSSVGVSNGARVSIGQRVGAVGCTGFCTGPHLHFEVRVNGDPVDPMGWLP